jgi:hypothetical protein
MAARTVRDFGAPGDIWPMVDGWAQEAGFKLRETNGPTRVYQKGTGLLVAPTMLTVTQQGPNVHLETWLKISFFTRLFALFMLPAELGLESGGFKAALPRSMARNAVNPLLERIGQPPIS